MSGNRPDWLQRELSKVLGWDDFVIQGVVDAISNASSKDEIHEIVENFMDGNKAAAKLINEFWANKGMPQAQTQTAGRRPNHHPNTAEPQQGAHNSTSPRSMNMTYSQTGAPPSSKQADLPAGYTLYNKWDNNERDYMMSASAPKGKGKLKVASAGTQLPSHTPVVTAAAKVQALSEPPPAAKSAPVHKSLGGTGGGSKQGSKSKKGGTARREGQLLAAASQLEKKVLNCLGCGKIFDCRNVTNEVIRFLESGGICTFCGKPVSLSYSSGSRPPTQSSTTQGPAQIGPSATDTPSQHVGGTAAGESSSEPDAATVAAIAFKDRLVEFDRNAAQRTTVIDDQSDYFEIDSNSWLNEQEREQLRRQQQVEEEAEVARRRRVKVTLDLLGRQVLLADDDYRAQERAVANALSGRDPATTSKTAPDGEPAAPGTMSMKDELNMVSHAQSEALKARTAASLRQLKITANPNITTPPPVFIPADKAADKAALPSAGQSDPAVANGKRKTSSGAAADSSTSKGGQQTPGVTSQRAANRKARLAQRKINRIQDENVFDEFEADLILDAAASSKS